MKTQKKLKSKKKKKATIYPCLIRLNQTLPDDKFASKLKRINILAKKSGMKIAKIDYDDKPHIVVNTCGKVIKRKGYITGMMEQTIQNKPQAIIYLERING